MSLAEQILDLLRTDDGLAAFSIATKLDEPKDVVNSRLRELRASNKVQQDTSYKWHLADNTAPNVATPQTNIDIELNKICQYYLHCLSLENGGKVEVLVRSDALDYVELSHTNFNETDYTDGVGDLVAKVSANHSAYFGYPTLLERSTPHGNPTYKLVPLLLWQAEVINGRFELQSSMPGVNPEIFNVFPESAQGNHVYDVINLEHELGFDNPEATIELDEVIARLTEIRPAWSWRDAIDVNKLNTTAPLSQLETSGIYNKAVLVLSERTPYTRGLEIELNQLANLSEDDYRGTALYDWIHPNEAIEAHNGNCEVIEVLPLNTEQEQAVKTALTKRLSIVTGPPGTGKSQVVTDLLINTALWGKSALFASKNNKAVDVVEARVNTLGTRPILLRVGANAYAAGLATFVRNLLAANSTPSDIAEYEYIQRKYKEIFYDQHKLIQKKSELINARNRLDALEQNIEKYRIETAGLWHSEIFDRIPEYRAITDRFEISLRRVQKALQPFFKRMIWAFFRKKREIEYERVAVELNLALSELNMGQLPPQYESFGVASATQTIELIRLRLNALDCVREYNDALSRIEQSESIEQVDKRTFDIKAQLSDCAKQLWKLWLITQSAPVSKSDRAQMLNLLAALRLQLNNGGVNTETAKQISDYIAKYVPCWAVTSLSAKGRIPFTAGMYDLLIIDEASQCDIASALPLLFRAKRAVIIGDPKQLNHITQLSSKQDMTLLQRYEITEKFSYSKISLFDFANAFASPENIINLRDHHRSHRDIVGYSNHEFYEERLRVATKYDRFVVPAGMNPGLTWINVRGTAERPSKGGTINRAEADKLIEKLSQLVLTDVYRGSIGVVTPFKEQANYIRNAISRNKELSSALQSQNDFLVDTVHKFQGDERDVMLFSPAVSDGISDGSRIFLQNTGNLFNVAVTRARAILIVVGNREYCMNCGIGYLENFARYSARLETQGADIATHEIKSGREYPIVQNPEQVSDWERVLYTALFDAGIISIPQYPVEQYKLDFAIFDNKRQLNIEVDGEQYHKDWTGELAYRDQLRNHRLYELGWDVIRFWVYEIRDDIDWCVQRVEKWQALMAVDTADREAGLTAAPISERPRGY
jgi:very-short-patch-repair endonuclease